MRCVACNPQERERLMSPYRLRPVDGVLVALAIVLTLATGYIHFWVGGTLLLLNSAGYLTLAIATGAAAILFRRGLPLVLIALTVYAAVTIGGWLVMGPYFDVAYLAKAIEIVLISTNIVWLARNRVWARESVAWALTAAKRLLRVGEVSESVTAAGQE